MIDIDRALAHLSTPIPNGGWPAGAPAHELARSRASAEVGQRAAAAGLFLFHYEHRVRLEPPEAWLEGEDQAPEWVDGVLGEPKYQAFRHDLPIGSFHPGHRAKWTSHELCHALVGFAFRPGASPLFDATAARLAELVPVVLWYFLDEIGLRRCPRHDGPLFRTFCADCQRAALEPAGPIEAGRAEALLRQAARFVDGELGAMARTRRIGRPCPWIWGSLDLCSDGLAYARGHGPRLRSRSFAAFAERFLRPGDPWWQPSLEALEARALAVLGAILYGDPLEGQGSRDRWVAWDLGQRLLEVWEECEGQAAGRLLSLVDRLAEGAPPSEIHAAYTALDEEFVLAPPEEVFALGYAVDGLPGRSVAQIAEGLMTVTPLTLALAEDAGVDLVGPFVAADRPERVPLGVRFAGWLSGRRDPVSELARYEAGLRSARGEPEAAVLGGQGEGLRLLDGAEVHRFGFDVVRFAERVDAGEIGGTLSGGELRVEAPDEPPTALILARDGQGALVMADLPPEWADAVRSSPEALPAEVRAALVEVGLLVPERWRLEG